MVRGTDKFTRGVGFSSRHLRYNDYLDRAQEIQGRWVGKGCERYGVTQGEMVKAEAFDRLADNKHALTQSQVTQRQNTTRLETYRDSETGEERNREVNNRKPFLDMTCSMPKTFSVAYGPGGLGMVRKWQDRAVEKVIAEMERHTARQIHNGREHVERTGSFCATRYSHDTNRSLEPQVHDHLTVMNMTRSADGKDYAVEFRELLDRSRYFTELYWDSLRADAEAAGFKVAVGEHGQPELEGLQDLAETYSQRTRQIESLVERVEGIVGTRLTNAEAKQIALASRGLDVEKFQERWEQKKPILAGFKSLDPERAEADRIKILREFTREVWRASDGGLQEVSASEVAKKQQAILNQEQRARLAEFPHTADPSRQVSRDRSLEEDLSFSVAHLFEKRSVLKDYELYEALVQHAQGKNVEPEAMRAAIAANPELVLGRHGKVTTLEHLRMEVETLRWVAEGRGRGIAVPAPDLEGLNPQQAEAARLVLGCADRFSALSGAAGVGKTHSLSRIIAANLAGGHRVAVTSPSDEACERVKEQVAKLPKGANEAGVLSAAVNLDKFLTNPALHGKLGRGDLLVVDEASMVSSRQGHAVQQMARDRGFRILFMGDKDQLRAVDAGDHFRVLLQKSMIHTTELHRIVRQPQEALDGHYLQACKLFKAGRATEGFSELHKAGCIVELQGQDRVTAMSDAILSAQAEGRDAIAVCPTHRENAAIGDAVRKGMFELGQLTDERIIQAHRTLGWTAAQKRELQRLAPGMVLEFTRGPSKGQTLEVVEVAPRKVIARDGEGRRCSINRESMKALDVCERCELPVALGDKLLIRAGCRDKRGDSINGERVQVAKWTEGGDMIGTDGGVITSRNLAHGYSATTYKSQGSTATEVLIGIDRNAVRTSSVQDAYVAVSRGQLSCRLFVENVADLSRLQKNPGTREAAVEVEFSRGELRTPAQKLFDELQSLAAARQHPDQDDVNRRRVLEVSEALVAEMSADLQASAVKTPAEFPVERGAAQNIPNIILVTDRERDLWERAAVRYPVETRTPELQKQIERTIMRKLAAAEHAKHQHQAPEWHPGIKPPERGYERSI